MGTLCGDTHDSPMLAEEVGSSVTQTAQGSFRAAAPLRTEVAKLTSSAAWLRLC